MANEIKKNPVDKAPADRDAALKAANAKMATDRAAAERARLAKAQADRLSAQKKGTVTARSLRIRKDHNTDSEVVAGLVKDNKVTILETWTDGKNTRAKLGPDQWAAMVYAGETNIKLDE